jgi:anti-sigma factor RsiW
MTCRDFWNRVPDLESAETDSHLDECPDCAARLNRYGELKAGLRALGDSSRRMQAPPRVEASLRAAFRKETGVVIHMPRRRWIPVVTWATAFAAMFALAAFLVRPRQTEAVRPPAPHSTELALWQPTPYPEGFIALPNSTHAPSGDEDVNLVRVEVPRSAMLALGFDIGAERAEELVEADVMLGPDGVARAVRFLN